MDIKGKKVLVTGGAVRAGAALCRAFAAAGAKVVIHFNSSCDAAMDLLAELGGESAGHSVFRCDLSDIPAAQNMIAELSPLDILVNNASVFERKNISSESYEDAMRQFAVNFFAPVELMKSFAVGAYKAGLGEAVIVNILDQAIARNDSSSFSYSMSKKALGEATLNAALNFAPRIRVNAVAPGPMLPPPGLEHLKMEKTLKTVPLARAVALDDFASACIFLASNSSVTGEILYVDCGQSLIGG